MELHERKESENIEPTFKRNVILPDINPPLGPRPDPDDDDQSNVLESFREGFSSYFKNKRQSEVNFSFASQTQSYSGETIMREICMLEAQRGNSKLIMIVIGVVRILMILSIQFRSVSLISDINPWD